MTSPLTGLKQKQGLLRILVFSLATIFIWIIYSLFHSQNTTEISPELLKLAEPLNPNINIDILQRIEQKKVYSDTELSSFPINRVVMQSDGSEQIVRGFGTAALITSPLSTPSAVVIPSPTPIATRSANGKQSSSSSAILR